MDSDLQQAIKLIKSGDKNRGGQLLSEILKKDPHNANAWLWLSGCVDTNEKKIYCLKKVLEIDPNYEVARTALSKIQKQPEQPSEQEILGNNLQLAKPNQPAHQKGSSIAPMSEKGSGFTATNFLLTAGIISSVICIMFLVGAFVVTLRNSPANNSVPSQQTSPTTQPTAEPLPTVTSPPASTPQPVLLPGPARRYVPVTNEGMPASYQYPIIDEYRLDDGDYYQIKFQALDGANILYEEPSYFFSVFVGDTIDNATKKYRDSSQDFQVDSDDWKYQWGVNTYPGSLFSESGQYVGYMGYFVESGRIFRVNNVVVLISVRIRNLNGITISDVNRIQQDLDKLTVIVDLKFP